LKAESVVFILEKLQNGHDHEDEPCAWKTAYALIGQGPFGYLVDEMLRLKMTVKERNLYGVKSNTEY